jgi:hypothetical protein
MLFRNVFTLALVSAACASPSVKRQGTDTNAAILPPLNTLLTNVTETFNAIQVLIASHGANDTSIGPLMDQLSAAYNVTTTALAGISPSIGSNTTSPTDNDIAVSLGDSLSKTSSSLSDVTSSIVPEISTFLTALDAAVAGTVDAFNTTAPAQASSFVHILMLDARQFFADENMTDTLAALGFPPTVTF